MQNTDILQLIKSLSISEYTDALHFVASPAFSTEKQAILNHKLLASILASAPDFSEEAISKEKIYKSVFPREKWIKGKLDKVMVETIKKLHIFLLIKDQLRAEKAFEKELKLSQIFRERAIINKYLLAINALKRKKEAEKFRGIEYFFEQYLLEYEIFDWESLNNKSKDDINLLSVIQTLDMFYYHNKIDLQNRLLLQQKTAKLESTKALELSLKAVEPLEEYSNDSVELTILQKINFLLKNTAEIPNQFQQLEVFLEGQKSQLSNTSLQAYYSYLRNICMVAIQNGHHEFWQEYHRVLQKCLENGFLYYEGKIIPTLYFNLVHAAIKAQNFDWLKNFLEESKDLIIGDTENKELFNLNKAVYLFAIGEYDASLELVPPTSRDIHYNFVGRRLEIKLYYEKASDLLNYKIDSFKMLVSRTGSKQLPTGYLRAQADFINLVIQIIKSSIGDQARSERIVSRIMSKPNVPERDWLLQKARQIVKR